VAAGDRAERVGEGEQHETEGEGDGDRAAGLDAGHGGAHADEHEQRGAQELCDERAGEGG
jgi:hypothetical protein